ncbi:MAG: SCO family protein [Planctomycetes bacterium]|nr:SCO family protein [Planctomycetota bacterium]
MNNSTPSNSTPNSTALPYWLSLMVLLAACYMGWKWYQVSQFEANRSTGGIEMAGPPLEEFELQERSGKMFRSADMQGKIWVTTFFFSTCPGPCARLNERIKYMHNQEELKDVTWVSITVDPKTDTLEVLRTYADKFSADPERWFFCRGDLKYIKRVGKEIMKLPVTWQGHNESAVVIDRTGKVRGMYDMTSISQSKKLELLLKKCLAETTSPENQPETKPAELGVAAEQAAT